MKTEYMVVITIIIWVFLFGTEATEKMELEDWKTEKKNAIF